ncbi:hypothetical protein JCM17823_19480 [Halorubrum gandharaense]
MLEAFTIVILAKTAQTAYKELAGDLELFAGVLTAQTTYKRTGPPPPLTATLTQKPTPTRKAPSTASSHPFTDSM